VPKNVLAKNFGQPLSAFDNIPGRQLYIFPGTPPPKNVEDDEVVPNNTPEPYTFAASKVPAIQAQGGSYKIVDSTTFKVAKTIAMAEVTVQPGGMR
jgi:oxalate decarboxylase/phosphoglucose isomerase-like protein (cupin superfamily)